MSVGHAGLGLGQNQEVLEPLEVIQLAPAGYPFHLCSPCLFPGQAPVFVQIGWDTGEART